VKKKNDQKWPRLLKDLELASSLGFIISLPVVFGALTGVFLDKRFNSAPILTLGLILLGSFAGACGGIKKIKEIV